MKRHAQWLNRLFFDAIFDFSGNFDHAKFFELKWAQGRRGRVVSAAMSFGPASQPEAPKSL
jgi:hypothetical protein